MIELKEKVHTCEEILSEIEEEMCSMKMNKDSFRRFHQYMDQLPENEKQKQIDIRKFFVPDKISECQLIPKVCDQDIFIEEPTATAAATATVTMSEAEIETLSISQQV